MRRFITTAFLLLAMTATAQRQYQYFYGTVSDLPTHRLLPGVNITFQGVKQGYVTDKKGAFSFFLDTIPVYMNVSYMGYETKKIWLDGTSPKLNILLSPVPLTLPEVEIVAKAGPEAFYKDDTYAVLDYEVDSSRVYILIYRHTLAQAELICKTTDGKPVSSSGQLSFRPDSLFRDCLQFVHLMEHDSSYQVWADTDAVRLIYPTPTEKLKEILRNCVASTPSKLFYKKVTMNGFGVDFYRIDRETHLNEKVTSVVDEESMKRLRDNKDDYRRIRSSTIPDGRSEFQEWSFARKIMYRPSTASMVRIGEHICIFNTADMTIEFYTPAGDFASKVKLDALQAQEGRWTKEIYTDEMTNKVYTSYIRNGEVTLFRINLETGTLIRSTKLAHLFPQQVKVHDGKVFYMYNVPGEPDNKQLYVQNL